MVSKVAITLVLLGMFVQRSLAAPATDDMLKTGSQLSTLPLRSSLEQPRTTVYDVETLLLSPPYRPLSMTAIQPDRGSILVSSSYSQSHTLTQPINSSAPYAKTITVTEEIPTTITVSASPVTVTEILVPPPPTPPSNSPSRTSTTGLGPAKSIWLAPTDLSDLSAFHVSKFTGGQENLKFVNSVPAKVQGSIEVASPDDRVDNALTATTLLQLLFPAGSINPGKKPQGGAEFYASPIDITSARNVTLQYSVLFPLGFDFVLAGKMPGLYGGHTGCSGGDTAVDCFSTRLMWREGGAGELYLYAPKDKQTDELCRAEGSVCDEMYGFSIGRGSFSWKRGDWTMIRQTVVLNTPGKQDGVFTLEVDGKRAISRDDILYRDSRGSEKGDGKGKAQKRKTTTKHAKPKPTTTTTMETSTDDGDFLGLGPLLSALLGGLRREVDPSDDCIKSPFATTVALAFGTTPFSSSPSPNLIPRTLLPTRTQIPESPSQDLIARMDSALESRKEADVKFVGIFFSTFFGGHDDKYATPKDQHIWFKDFGLAYNS